MDAQTFEAFLTTARELAGRLGPVPSGSGVRRPPNVFTVLGLETAEVIQSRFLAWLLDPRGDHGEGSRFFRAFLDASGLDIALDDDYGYDVGMEAWEGEAFTDIVVSREGRFLIHVEHKVHAAEQPGQVDREFRDMRRAGSRLGVPTDRQFAIFLNPTGRAPRSGDASPWIVVSHGDLAECFSAAAGQTSDAHVRRLVDDWVDTTHNWRRALKVMPFTEQSRLLVANYDCITGLRSWASDLADQLTATVYAAASELLVDDWQREPPCTPNWFQLTRPRWWTASGATALLLGTNAFTPQSLLGLGGWPYCFIFSRLKAGTEQERQGIERLDRELRDALAGRSDIPGDPGSAGYIRCAELPRCRQGDIEEYAEELRDFTRRCLGAYIAFVEEMEPAIGEHLGG